MKNLPILLLDAYKFDHRSQYPEGTNLVYSNMTPRTSRMQGVNKAVFFGLQYFVKEYLISQFNENFFKQDIDEICKVYSRRVNNTLGKNNIGDSHIRALHKLGYLPIRIKAVPEGTRVPLRVPFLTIVNTHPDFFWLTNYLETLISNVIWLPITSATTAFEYKQLLTKWAEKTSDQLGFVQFQAHDFSMRGMTSIESCMTSGAGHLLSFVGTDSVPSINFLEDYYNANSDNELVGCSVPASEHSTATAYGKDKEFEYFERLITEVYPSGIVSIVSDSYDLWKVLTDFLPRLKNKIVNREGKVVIRPDSSRLTPVQIMCGLNDTEIEKLRTDFQHVPSEPEIKGVIECLWDVFGGIVNSKGYKELDPHIGAIYGDSITLQRAQEICERLAAKGFASTNAVYGIGSYTYQYVTRDTLGTAFKSTYVEVNGEARTIFKDPVTDSGVKKSARGLIQVEKVDGELVMNDEVSWEVEETGVLETVFEDGKLVRDSSLSEIRQRLIGA